MTAPDLIERCANIVWQYMNDDGVIVAYSFGRSQSPVPKNIATAVIAEFLTAIREPEMVVKIAAQYGGIVGLPWAALPEQSGDAPCREDLRRVIRHAMLALAREITEETKP